MAYFPTVVHAEQLEWYLDTVKTLNIQKKKFEGKTAARLNRINVTAIM